MSYSPTRALMRQFGAADNRDVYVSLNWLGDRDPDDELPGDLEADLPHAFQRDRLDEDSLTEETQ